MVTLALDAALSIGSVAVLDDSRVLAERETRMRDPDRERLLPTMMETIGAAGISLGEVERIVLHRVPEEVRWEVRSALMREGYIHARFFPLRGCHSDGTVNIHAEKLLKK